MIVEFLSHPEGAVVSIDPARVRAVIPARGGLPLSLVRCVNGMDVVVRGTRDEVQARLDRTGEGPALRMG
jgi:hypothetical protein